jgi:hypothetical protein
MRAVCRSVCAWSGRLRRRAVQTRIAVPATDQKPPTSKPGTSQAVSATNFRDVSAIRLLGREPEPIADYTIVRVADVPTMAAGVQDFRVE